MGGLVKKPKTKIFYSLFESTPQAQKMQEGEKKKKMEGGRDYKAAKETLFKLTSNQDILNAWKKQRLQDKSVDLKREMEYHLQQLSIHPSHLSVIHVAGTKGKGSTCAFTESILRHKGFKTGLFTSPHLREPRERIKINGIPISEQLFAHYFWSVYDTLKQGLVTIFHFRKKKKLKKLICTKTLTSFLKML